MLRQVAGKNYALFVRILEAEGIIENLKNSEGGDSYVAGERAKLFRWRVPVRGKPVDAFRVEKITDKCTIKGILRTSDRHNNEEIRIKAALPEELKWIFHKLARFTEDVVILPFPENTEEGNLYMQALANDEYAWNTVDKFGERYHSPLTLVPKVYRRYLRFKGREDTHLVLLDFSNSQPFFSSIVGCGEVMKNLLPEFLPVATIFQSVVANEDYQLYQRVCCEGKFYECFDMDRDVVKKRIFSAVLYADKVLYSKDKQFRAEFQKKFPSVVSIADKLRECDESDLPELKEIIKPAGSKSKSKESNASNSIFPCMMQRCESRIMFRHIAPEMLRQGIGPFLTVHDSFILLPEHENAVREIITSVFKKLQVPEPNVKQEILI